jgi:LytS/YehU family sensor histidine kinase
MVGALMKLTSLLRAVLRTDGEFVTLGEELELIVSYLDIERARFEEQKSRSQFEIAACLALDGKRPSQELAIISPS